MKSKNFVVKSEFLKVDASLRLVLGWGIICKEAGEDYTDLQADHIPEASMLEAATDFMLHSRAGKEQHVGKAAGSIVFAWPMTTEIAKAFDIDTKGRTGLMIAMRPDNDEMLAKFQSGEYTGFSIGGVRIEDEVVEVAA